jgi:hypothetical protein
METEEDVKQRLAVEAAGNKIPGLEEKKEKEPKKPRNVRRLEKSKKEFLDELVLKYFVKRSTLADPDGTEAAYLFEVFNQKWIQHCKCFNVRREPIKLRYEAFTESVTFYIDMEKAQMKKTAEENKGLGFVHWLRREVKWNTYPFRLIWYWIKALGSKEKEAAYWKLYYITHGTN